MSLVKEIFKRTLGMLLAIWVLVEDVFWSICENATKYISRIKWIKKVEEWLGSVNSYAALLMFAVPILMLLPFKLLALHLMHTGSYGAGLMVFIFAKVVGTTVGARLFVILKPKLLKINWFKYSFEKLMLWKLIVINYAKTSYTYRLAVIVKRKVKKIIYKSCAQQ